MREVAPNELGDNIYSVALLAGGSTASDPNQPTPETPSAADVEAAKTAASDDLVKMPTEVVAAEQDNLTVGSSVAFADAGTKAKASAVIAVNQSVAVGGAVVLATELDLPFNSQSVTGGALSKPASFSELLENYSIMKYFENNQAIDLLDEFGSGIFSYSASGAKLQATIVIIDGPAPASDSDVIRPASGSVYGVKLSADRKYLYIYDGVADGFAKDPIALIQTGEGGTEDPGSSSGGSSGGCSAAPLGGMLLLLTASAIVWRRAK